MLTKFIAQNEEIVIGTDVHDMRHNVAIVSMTGEIMHEVAMPATRTAWKNLMYRLPGCKITVVYEAGPHGYNLHDLALAYGCKCCVVAPQKHLGIKTDKRDARSIARDYLAKRAEIVTVPEPQKRIDRQLQRTRESLVKESTRLKNQLSGMKRFHGIGPTGLDRSNKADITGLLEVIELVTQLLDEIKDKIAQIDGKLKKLMATPAYERDFKQLTAITGVGPITAASILLNVADAGKFKKSKNFASYLGLCPGEYSSGKSRRQGHITRRGPGTLRGLLVQCAWRRVRSNTTEEEKFNQQSAKIGRKKAIVAAARRLAGHIWWQLKEAQQQQPIAA